MAKALLIACNRAESPYFAYPLGLTLVAEAARARGHAVAQWDCQTAEHHRAEMGSYRAMRDGLAAQGGHRADLGETLERLAPQVVGLSLRDLDYSDGSPMGAGGFVRDCAALVAEIRRHGEYTVVVGGAGYSLFPEELFEALGADYGVVGEGEEVFADLLDLLDLKYAPKRRIWESQTRLAPERLRPSARDGVLARGCLAGGGLLNVQTKRGCDGHCAHCAYPRIEGPVVRQRSGDDVADEFRMLRDLYGVRHLVVTDAAFNDRAGRYLEVAEALARRNLGIEWTAFLRPGRWDREKVALLRRAGMRGAEWSTDGTTDATLEALNKGFTWSDVEHSNRLFAEAGMASCHFVTFGGPGETAATLREGLRRVSALRRSVVQAWAGVRIVPNTPLHARALAEGMVREGESLLESHLYASPDVDPRAVRAAQRQAIRGAEGRVVATRLGIVGAAGDSDMGPEWMDRVAPV